MLKDRFFTLLDFLFCVIFVSEALFALEGRAVNPPPPKPESGELDGFGKEGRERVGTGEEEVEGERSEGEPRREPKKRQRRRRVVQRRID